jgi:23S rRNA pseudouridine2605 synthase
MSERIQKFLSGLGYGSRREIEEWIVEGRLVVNGEPATIGLKVSEADAIKLDGKRLSLKAGNEPLRVLLYKKRTGEMVTRDDPEGRRTVFRKLPELETGRWIAVGRLDVNTSGLLLMTNHGELARRLMHPSFEQRREYAVRALGEVRDDAFANLRKGVELEDGSASFESIRFGDNEVDDDEAEGEGGGRANHWFIVTITEGRHREVRRLFESQGLIVNRLIRTGYGPIKLGGGIKSGSYREATAEELRKLLDAVNLDAKELAPERVRESHRTKSDYTAQRAPDGETASQAMPAKRGDSKKAHRAAALAKRETRTSHKPAAHKASAWTRASKDERKLVERQERRSAKFGAPDESPVYRLKPAAAPGSSPWGQGSGKGRVEVLRDGDDEAPPQQFKAKGFGAKSERSYQERGDHAPTTPTRRYRDETREERPRGSRDDQPKWGARDKPSTSKPYGSRTSRDPSVFRPRTGDGSSERSGFKPKPWGEKNGSEKTSSDKPWGHSRDGERTFRKPAGDKPAFRPAREGGRGERERPVASNAWSGKPARDSRPGREGFEKRPSREVYGAKPAYGAKRAFAPRKAAAARPTQRFVVKDGAATRPGAGKPKLGLGARKKRETDE